MATRGCVAPASHRSAPRRAGGARDSSPGFAVVIPLQSRHNDSLDAAGPVWEPSGPPSAERERVYGLAPSSGPPCPAGGQPVHSARSVECPRELAP